MKNIDCDSFNAYAIMCGSNWVATPFCINFGYRDHGYEDDYLEEYYDYGETISLNIFGKEKKEVIEEIKHYMSPKNYVKSFGLGDVSEFIYGSPTKEYNTIQVLIYKNKFYVAACWLDHYSSLMKIKDFDSFVIKSTDYNLIGYVTFSKDIIDHPKLMTFDVRHFKYTLGMYKEDLFIRFLEGFEKKKLQYTGKVRMDSGTDEGNIFSIIKTIELPNDVAKKCTRAIALLNNKSIDEF